MPAEGRYLEALECMERALILRHRMFGGKAPEVLAACKSAGELCNLLAMTYLQRGTCGSRPHARGLAARAHVRPPRRHRRGLRHGDGAAEEGGGVDGA